MLKHGHSICLPGARGNPETKPPLLSVSITRCLSLSPRELPQEEGLKKAPDVRLVLSKIKGAEGA